MNIFEISWVKSVLICTILTFIHAKDTFSELSSDSFRDIACVPYAYGDFNADKRVDIFCVSKTGKQFEIWLAQDKEPLFYQYGVVPLNKGSASIVNIVPGDFNGDSIMDLLIVYKMSDHFEMSLYLGNKLSKNTNELKNEILVGLNIADEPFVGDFDGDGKLDIFVQHVDSNQAKIYSFYLSGIKYESLLKYTSDSLLNGYAHSIADVNGDFIPDLIITAKHGNGSTIFKTLNIDNHKSEYVVIDEYSVPNQAFVYGQSLFADFDSDGNFEHLLPACKDNKCDKSVIFMRKNNKWTELPIDFSNYGFIPPDEAIEFWGTNSISVKSGDYNLNGYLDLMAVLRDKNNSSKDQYAVLMKNVINDLTNATNDFQRTFKIDKHIMSLFQHNNVVQASFFDLFDDGYLDILLVLKVVNAQTSEISYKVIALKNEYYDDVYFMKVMVIPGNCIVSRCPNQSLPYGLNYPGALVKMETTSFEYQRVVMYAVQLSQSSHMALQLPYTIFGLGTTPNFVEHFTMGIMAKTTDDSIRAYKKEWHQIIPNSQLVISPYPRHLPNNWKMQLFITPSKNILMTGISLGSTMICLVILIGVLQYREKKMDEKERKLESQRFHFDGL